MSSVASLDAPSITQLIATQRLKYNRSKRRIRYAFDELFTRFANGESQSDVARDAKVSREWIRQIFNEFFKVLFDNITGLERRNKFLEKKKNDSVEERNAELLRIDGLVDDTPLGRLILRAREYGLYARRVRTINQKIEPNLLIVHEQLCRVHVSTTTIVLPGKNNAGYSYHPFVTSKTGCKDVSHVIYHSSVQSPRPKERTFIVPVRHVRKALFFDNKKRRTILLACEERKRPRKVFFDLRPYEDGWHSFYNV